jgi:hypothetical protein
MTTTTRQALVSLILVVICVVVNIFSHFSKSIYYYSGDWGHIRIFPGLLNYLIFFACIPLAMVYSFKVISSLKKKRKLELLPIILITPTLLFILYFIIFIIAMFIKVVLDK